MSLIHCADIAHTLRKFTYFFLKMCIIFIEYYIVAHLKSIIYLMLLYDGMQEYCHQ